MSTPYPTRVAQAHLRARAAADEAGIDAALIDSLVERFYGDIRAHPQLGPIFAEEIGADWAPHLATMKRFWSALIFHDGSYSGRPLPAHAKLKRLTPEHFSLWLALFETTLKEIGASDAAQAAFLERAHRIAKSFQLHLFPPF